MGRGRFLLAYKDSTNSAWTGKKWVTLLWKGVFSVLFLAGSMGLTCVYYKIITVIGVCDLLYFHMFSDFTV